MQEIDQHSSPPPRDAVSLKPNPVHPNLGEVENSALESSKSHSQGTSEIVNFIRLFKNHIQHVRTTSPELTLFLDEFFGTDEIAMLSQLVVEKMRLTKSDGKQHGHVLSQRRPVIYHISTLPVEMGQTKDWFVHKFGGYTKMLSKLWNSTEVKAADCAVWCNIVYGWTKKGAWVQLSILPMKKPAPIDTSLVPLEFLTPEERQLLGL
ncbi:MAG: hypothetical protein QGM50_08410 [Anaerolineae bacterium]|nr:hypothetical protein [Anaerolineae bacterium]